MEISAVDISNASEVGSLPNQAENKNKYMDVKFYNAAVESKFNVLKEQADHLDRLLTPRNNTILHIHISAQPQKLESTEFVKSVLDKCPQLLFHANEKGETPLHIAARFGHHRAVEVLMEHAKSRNVELESGRKIWTMTNNQKDTALHEAVRMTNIEVVRLLIKEDPAFSYSANETGETPLYLAVERSYNDIASEILDTCTSPIHGGPNGRTTLHAAVINLDREMTERILERTGRTLTSEVDEEGWSPLDHCALNGSLVMLKLLLEVDKSAAYIPSKDEHMTPLLIALKEKHGGIVKELILQCPDCSELVDHRGRNAFHHAMPILQVPGTSFSMAFFDFPGIISFFLSSSVINNLINEKDREGNTPLHQLAELGLFYRVTLHPLLDKHVVNNMNKTALDVLLEASTVGSKRKAIKELKSVGCRRSIRKQIKIKTDSEMSVDKPEDSGLENTDGSFAFRKIRKALLKARESHLVVATLIATVTFAAGFTMPGGYISDKDDPDRGFAILSRNTAFQAFIITDTIAMLLSTCVVFLHFLIAGEEQNSKTSNWLYYWILYLTLFSMGAMVIAFATGTYSVLGNSSGIAITIIIMSLFFFFFCYQIFRRRD